MAKNTCESTSSSPTPSARRASFETGLSIVCLTVLTTRMWQSTGLVGVIKMMFISSRLPWSGPSLAIEMAMPGPRIEMSKLKRLV